MQPIQYIKQCLIVCLSVATSPRPHIWVNPDETLQGDPGGFYEGRGGRMLNHPHASLGLGSKFKKAVAEVATVELFCFLCHRKANNYACTFVAGCMQQFLIVFKLLQLPL